MERTMISTRTGSSKSSTRKKYLGEPEDPHFVPDSPIISRQSFTFEQEEELTRSCTLVLSSVPHSDDSEEDPLMKYITAQIALKPIRNNVTKEKPIIGKAFVGTAGEFSSGSHKTRQVNDDTATPSEASKRNTIDRTNTSTPLTILSETVCRPPSTRQNTTVKTDSHSSQSQAVRALLDRTLPYDQHQNNNAASKSMTSLTGLRSKPEQQATSVVTGKVGNISIAHVEFNKRLPAIPHEEDVPVVGKQSNGILRLFKATKKPPVTTIVENDLSDPTLPAKKPKFSFASLFERRRKQQTAPVSI